jgi:hypothetical protein
MTNPFKLAAMAVAATLLLSTAAQAQSKKELAEKAVQLQQSSVEGIGRAMAGQVAQQVLQTAGQAMGSVPADKREAVGKEVQAEVKKFYDELEGQLRARALKLAPATLAPVLEEKFTEEELKQLVTWLETSASKKYQQVGAELQSLLANKLVEDTRPTVEPKLRALEKRLQQKLGIEPPASPASGAKPAAAPKKK